MSKPSHIKKPYFVVRESRIYNLSRKDFSKFIQDLVMIYNLTSYDVPGLDSALEACHISVYKKSGINRKGLTKYRLDAYTIMEVEGIRGYRNLGRTSKHFR